MPQQLSDLAGREVSLVGRAANRRRFLLTKKDGGQSVDEVKALQTIEKLDADGMGAALESLAGADPAELAALLKGTMTDEEKQKITAAVRVLGSDVLKKMPAFLREAGMMDEEDEDESAKKLKAKKKGKSMAKSEDTETPTEVRKNADGTWDVTAVPEAQRPSIEAVLKAADTREAELRAQLAKSDEAKAEAEAEAAKLTADKERNEAIAKAAEFKGLPGLTADDFAPDLIVIRKALTPERYEKFTKMLKGAATIVLKSGLLAEMGSGDEGSKTARAELNEKVDALRKSDGKLTVEQARARIYKSDKALMERVNAEDATRRAGRE